MERPRHHIIKTLLLLLTFATSNQLIGQTTIWPGDANDNGVCSHVDLLYIGLNWQAVGPGRVGATTNWIGQIVNQMWLTNTPSGINAAYSDSDGNGVVNAADIPTLNQNFGLTRPNAVPDTSTLVAVGAPTLSVEFQADSIPLQGVTTFLMDLVLGSPAQGIDSIHGIAIELNVDLTGVDSLFFNLDGGFMAPDSAPQSMHFVDTAANKIYLSITRTNGVNVSGSGSIGSIGIVMDENIRTNGNFTLGWNISSVFALTRSETPVPLTASGDSILVITGLTAFTPNAGMDIYPVPCQEQLVVDFSGHMSCSMTLISSQGHVLREMQLAKGIHHVDVSDLPQGVYFLRVRHAHGIQTRKFSIQR